MQRWDKVIWNFLQDIQHHMRPKKNGMKVFFPVILPLSVFPSFRYSPAPLLVLLRWSFHRLPHTLSNPLPAQFLGAQWLNPPSSNSLLKRGDFVNPEESLPASYIGKEFGIPILKRATTLYFSKSYVWNFTFSQNVKTIYKSNSLSEEKCMPCINSRKFFFINGNFVP